MGEEYEKKDLGTKGEENTLKGKLKQAAGKVQNKMGEMTGNTEEEMKGRAKEAEGTGQSTIGNVEKKIDDKLDR
ncbi:CsbD family protein [Tengunoibacter tsumagoiensis]|uniref:Uncharacterized protein n=1 Tax=Tengunoibacter tsumagoiensis TaxID=2014871 RepID=A0A402A0J9_9CHLR|nr:CsbD family protein [Tengunoibacter tsumagoiensis]GCE12582.1 hypothetical protein KTT_24410 [Tengunoibacter tsumagoiensis]